MASGVAAQEAYSAPPVSASKMRLRGARRVVVAGEAAALNPGITPCVKSRTVSGPFHRRGRARYRLSPVGVQQVSRHLQLTRKRRVHLAG
jgi:hypothetical protein